MIMTQRWKALILTQSNVLQNVEIETPGPWREDAIAQVKSTYGAKEVKFCNPIDSPSSSTTTSSSSSSSSSTDASWSAILGLGILFLIYVFRYMILAAIVIGGAYLLYKWYKNHGQSI